MSIYIAGILVAVLIIILSYWAAKHQSEDYDPWWHVNNSEWPGGMV